MAWLRKRLKISERPRISAIKLLLIVDRLDLPVSYTHLTLPTILLV